MESGITSKKEASVHKMKVAVLINSEKQQYERYVVF